MGIGDPIGRSAGNPSRQGARRRFSESERLQYIPALDETTFKPPLGGETWVERLRERNGLVVLIWCILVGAVALLLVLL